MQSEGKNAADLFNKLSSGTHLHVSSRLNPRHDLLKEALEQSVDRTAEGVSTRVFRFEHLLAIMVETGRPKDKARLLMAVESTQPDETILQHILQRHGLIDKWSRIVE